MWHSLCEVEQLHKLVDKGTRGSDLFAEPSQNMSFWEEDDFDYDPVAEQDRYHAEIGLSDQASTFATGMTFGTGDRLQPGERFSSKIPPLWDGSRSYYLYEKDVWEWCPQHVVLKV